MNTKHLRFSGHETFPCRIHWLNKGISFLDKYQADSAAFSREDAVVELGVGKNMVRSIQHWMRAFGLLGSSGNTQDFLDHLALFLAPGDDSWDEYIEDEATLWLLHYALVTEGYASLYRLLFVEFPSERPMLEFTIPSLIRYVQTYVAKSGGNYKSYSENSIKKDIQVLLSLYGASKKSKNPEEDAVGLFLHLDLIRPTGQVNELGEPTYSLHRNAVPRVPLEVFAYCLLRENAERKQLDFDDVHQVAQLFGATFEGTELLIDQMVKRKWASYSSEAGVKSLKLYKKEEIESGEMLERYYLPAE